MIRVFLLAILFFVSACARLSYEDIKSKEYGLVLYRLVSNEEISRIDVGTPYTRGRAGRFPDEQIQPPSHKQKIIDLKGDKNLEDMDYYYGIEYAKAGKYPLVLTSIVWTSFNSYLEKTATLKGCVDIKGGAINYIGDYYWKIGESKNISFFDTWFLGRKTFDTNIFSMDKQGDAKKFMAKYYSQYKAPFVYAPASIDNCPTEDK